MSLTDYLWKNLYELMSYMIGPILAKSGKTDSSSRLIFYVQCFNFKVSVISDKCSRWVLIYNDEMICLKLYFFPELEETIQKESFADSKVIFV